MITVMAIYELHLPTFYGPFILIDIPIYSVFITPIPVT